MWENTDNVKINKNKSHNLCCTDHKYKESLMCTNADTVDEELQGNSKCYLLLSMLIMCLLDKILMES